MWRNFVNRVIVPILFVLVGGYVCTSLVIKKESEAIIRKQIEAAEAQARAEAEAKRLEEERRRAEFKASSYDQVFKSVGEQYNIDWRLLAAIAKAESGYNYDIESPAGALGLMQIMPKVAEQFDISREQLLNVGINVDLAAQILLGNKKMLRLPENISEKEQWRFILACYNAGYGRVADARALAKHYGSNHNRWNDVAMCLGWLADPDFSKHKVVKYGAFHGSKETVGYVNKVMHIYNKYSNNSTDL